MDMLSVLLSQRTRKIGLLIPDVVVSEAHTDDLQIANHPVEMGANISDHAWKKPCSLNMDCGFSGGGSLLDFVDTTKIAIPGTDRSVGLGLSPKQAYDHLLEMQKNAELLTVVTGRRIYKNMLLEQISVSSDSKNSQPFIAKLKLTEVLLSSTDAIKTADKSEMGEGVSTSSVTNTGQKSMKPVNDSAINSGAAG